LGLLQFHDPPKNARSNSTIIDGQEFLAIGAWSRAPNIPEFRRSGRLDVLSYEANTLARHVGSLVHLWGDGIKNVLAGLQRGILDVDFDALVGRAKILGRRNRRDVRVLALNARAEKSVFFTAKWRVDRY
jgi:hypothetical protein